MKAIAIMGSGCVHDRRVLLSAAAAEAELLFQLALQDLFQSRRSCLAVRLTHSFWFCM